MLPNHRARFCTRILKIEPAIRMIRVLRKLGFDPVMYVGLRADEESRPGIYTQEATVRFPMREWGWGLREVKRYLDERGVSIPRRTDCAVCYAQRLSEWFTLWEEHRERFDHYAAIEARMGHTLRSDSRDTWPAALAELGVEFQRCIDGERSFPRGYYRQQSMFDDDDHRGPCRVCSL